MQEHILGLAATLTKFLWKGRGTLCFYCGCFLFVFIHLLSFGWLDISFGQIFQMHHWGCQDGFTLKVIVIQNLVDLPRNADASISSCLAASLKQSADREVFWSKRINVMLGMGTECVMQSWALTEACKFSLMQIWFWLMDDCFKHFLGSSRTR